MKSFQIKTTLTKLQTIDPKHYPEDYSKQDIIEFENEPETIIDSFEMSGGEGWEFKVEEVDEEDGNE